MLRDKIDEVNEVLKTLAPWEEKALRFGYKLKYDYLILDVGEADEKLGCSIEKIRQVIPKTLEHFYYSASARAKKKKSNTDNNCDRASVPVR